MKIYGYKIKNLTIACEISNFTTKILPLLTNLEKLEFHEEISFDNSRTEELSIKLKKLTISCILDLNKLHIFDIEEFEINFVYFNEEKNVVEFLQKHKNIKKFKTVDHGDKLDLKNLLKNLKLERLSIYLPYIEGKITANFLKSQKLLKELTIYRASIETFNVICRNLENLEKLKIDILDDTTEKDFRKFSKLKKLKILTLVQIKMTFLNCQKLSLKI
ncbi:hypothetical protein PVAND_015642 [Polypedilum vanderplanki]|uniref:Uncharacterized protein n=1 Tax=Polypedilum vanderplanki TaxID=319348 RepID=A0A9J6BDQ0_POLVA|nr:hypothetical protein PVAND_015642 [Polypedilum vanderplanki]